MCIEKIKLAIADVLIGGFTIQQKPRERDICEYCLRPSDDCDCSEFDAAVDIGAKG